MESFEDAIKAMAERARKIRGNISTEESTKTALIMPFISTLGYDVFNPLEVVPEFVADVASRKGEKVDYAIMQDGSPIMIIECKACGTALDVEKVEQLHRYFLTLDSSIGILTDGIRYLFYSRTEDGKKMDTRPFMEINLDNIDTTLIPELRKLCKGKFNLKVTLETVSELRFNRHIKLLLEQNLNDPDREFLRYFIRRADIQATQKAFEQFTGYVKRGFAEFLSEQVNSRLKIALNAAQKAQEQAQEDAKADNISSSDESIVEEITENEYQAYYVVKAILAGIMNIERIFLRKISGIGKSMVLLDDSQRKQLLRFIFKKEGKWCIEITGANKERISHNISKIDDIYKYADDIKRSIIGYDVQKSIAT
jgi:hypothetical protein